MTDHELRVKLCAAMGWTEIRAPQDGFEDWSGLIPSAPARAQLPNPLEFDADAARLRAWLIGDYWEVRIVVNRHHATVIVWREHDHRRHVETVHPATEPDPCRRERLALCRAVVQALEEEVQHD